MKIITWNVNGLRAVERKGEIQRLVETYEPDILLLQEIKGKKEQFSKYLTQNPKYRQFYHSAQKPGYAGTGIWLSVDMATKIRRIKFNMHAPLTHSSRITDEYELYRDEEIKTPYATSIHDQDNSSQTYALDLDEGRISHLSFLYEGRMFDVASIYFPNGGKSEQAWEEKLVFYESVLNAMNDLRKQGHEVIIGGDMNVAHNEIDLARPKENDGKIGFHPDERAWVDRVLKDGWVDVWRAKNPDAKDVYSWWDMKTRARERNVGWRIDYFFVDKDMLENVQRIEYLYNQMGSDHCPLLMELY